MSKKKKKQYSRLNPAYLASRHAGALFMLLALGLLGGIACRSLLQPTKYAAQSEVTVTVTPPEAAESFDWDEKQAEWRDALATGRNRDLLRVNLRFAVKLAATRDARIDTGRLNETLAGFDSGERFSASFFHNRFLARLGPVITVVRRDLAPNMDFQSLAAIVADLDPPHENAGNWDFSFFHNRDAGDAANGIIAEPGPADPFFQVFLRLHEFLRGEPADSPFTAWRTAADELTARLDREAAFAGGGGFGPSAKREIIREIMAIPAMAANGLYQINDSLTSDFGGRDQPRAEYRDGDLSIELRSATGSAGRLAVSAATFLHPVAYRRDTVYTRLPPLTAAVLTGFLAAREDRAAPPAPKAPVAPEPAPREPATATAAEAPADFVAELEPLEPAAETTYREVVDEAAAKERLALIAKHEESVTDARVRRDAAARRLEAARDAENRISRETVAARARADHLRERYDAAMTAAEADDAPRVPADTARLFAQRDEVLARLVTLLRYCTEEHPFVRQARRELDALEARLAGHIPDARANEAAEARATRTAGLYLEWETASEQADIFEERQRRQSEETTALLESVTGWERCILQFERDLAQAKESPVPVIRKEIAAAPRATPAPVVKPAPAPAVPPAPAAPTGARLAFASLPAAISLQTTPPGWQALWWGLLAGLCLGVLSILIREAFANRFRNADEAKRMMRLPVLATLPAYDMRSLRSAAAAMKGEVARTPAGKYQFIPAMVEYSEPPAEARRGKILPAARRPRFMVWMFGLLFLILGGLLYYRSLTGFVQPRLPGDARELPLPGITIPAWTDGEEKDWGNLP